MKKVKNSILQEFGKDSDTSIKQEHGKPVNKKEKLHSFDAPLHNYIWRESIVSGLVGIQ